MNKLRSSYWHVTGKLPTKPRYYSGYGCYGATRTSAHDAPHAQEPSNRMPRTCKSTRNIRNISNNKHLQHFASNKTRNKPVTRLTSRFSGLFFGVLA